MSTGGYQLLTTNSLKLSCVSYAKNIGQLLIGVNIGQQFYFQIVDLFLQKWPFILFINLLTGFLSILFGLLMWLVNGKKDLITSIISTSPGGITAIPSMSEDVGGDVITASVLHTLRLVIVVSFIPLLALQWNEPNQVTFFSQYDFPQNVPMIISMLILLIIALIGAKIWKFFNLPVPFLIGVMVATGLFNYLIDDKIYHLDVSLQSLQWPLIISQVLIGISIGVKFDYTFLNKLKGILLSKGIVIIWYILFMIICAWIFSNCFSIPLSTMLLAFSPGGASEMILVASSLNVDVPFVVTVQTLRLVMVVFTLPFLTKLIVKL